MIEFPTLEGRTPKDEWMAKVYVYSALSYATAKRWAMEARHGSKCARAWMIRQGLKDQNRCHTWHHLHTGGSDHEGQANNCCSNVYGIEHQCWVSGGNLTWLINYEQDICSGWRVPKTLIVNMKMDQWKKWKSWVDWRWHGCPWRENFYWQWNMGLPL